MPLQLALLVQAWLLLVLPFLFAAHDPTAATAKVIAAIEVAVRLYVKIGGKGVCSIMRCTQVVGSSCRAPNRLFIMS